MLPASLSDPLQGTVVALKNARTGMMAKPAMSATPTQNALAPRLADFSTLAEALDYAALGHTGLNFYDGRCRLTAVVPYAEVR
ncbi:hypothetical protein V2S84_19245, partial [Azotobacter chroococcum]|nr:hypothetical protein [Azotobacter chroococcum]